MDTDKRAWHLGGSRCPPPPPPRPVRGQWSRLWGPVSQPHPGAGRPRSKGDHLAGARTQQELHGEPVWAAWGTHPGRGCWNAGDPLHQTTGPGDGAGSPGIKYAEEESEPEADTRGDGRTSWQNELFVSPRGGCGVMYPSYSPRGPWDAVSSDMNPATCPTTRDRGASFLTRWWEGACRGPGRGWVLGERRDLLCTERARGPGPRSLCQRPTPPSAGNSRNFPRLATMIVPNNTLQTGRL